MCVLIYKPKGVKMPSRKVLEACHEANPDGCGFVTPKDYYRTLDFGRLMYRLSKVDTDPCILHFRFATHGSVKRANCHPFKNNDVYFAHNGVLPIQSEHDKTDSEIMFDKYIYPLIAKYGLRSSQVINFINQHIGASKFALMQGREVVTFGDFTKIDGVYFSNTRWRVFTDFGYYRHHFLPIDYDFGQVCDYNP